ncbi:hypothetical protein EBM89_17780 [Cellulomonas triticagri]|uniref:Uncharacterized protein n=1 Tax=Cellulomonas triticagri TaxID=2483352 RepID=A0A3M2J1C1_9CELL|nr:hypothetical protein EBM89_17780 [Cellulomonas triticagri]
MWRGARHIRLFRALGQALALTLCALGWLVVAPAEATRTTTQMHTLRDTILGTDYEPTGVPPGIARNPWSLRTKKVMSGRYVVAGTQDEALHRLFTAAELTDIDEPSCLRRIGRSSYLCDLTRNGFIRFGWVTIGSRAPSPGIEGERLVVITYALGPDAGPRVARNDSPDDYEPLAPRPTGLPRD